MYDRYLRIHHCTLSCMTDISVYTIVLSLLWPVSQHTLPYAVYAPLERYSSHTLRVCYNPMEFLRGRGLLRGHPRHCSTLTSLSTDTTVPCSFSTVSLSPRHSWTLSCMTDLSAYTTVRCLCPVSLTHTLRVCRHPCSDRASSSSVDTGLAVDILVL